MSNELPNLLPADDDFWDTIDDTAESSEKRQERHQFGKLTISPQAYKQWIKNVDGGWETIEITREKYKTLTENQLLEILFSIDVKELHPAWEWGPYTRTVGIGDKEWNRILIPSLKKILGKSVVSKSNHGRTLATLNGKYVHTKNTPKIGSDYPTIEFLEIFSSKEECVNARETFFATLSSTDTPATTAAPIAEAVPAAVSADYPEGWTADAWKGVAAEIKTSLAGGKSPAEVAADYGVPVPFVTKVK